MGGWKAGRAGAFSPLQEATLLCPCQPRQVISVGANYRDRCLENELPVPVTPGRDDTFVMAGDGVVVGAEAPIRPPPWEHHVDYGAELGIVIGRPAAHVAAREALDHVLGYVALNNLWAKTRPRVPGALNIRVYDSFCPVGPWIETALDPADLGIVLRLNGEVRQRTRTSSMLFDVPALVAHVSRLRALTAGDVIMTGTPSGVGTLTAGDDVEVEIEGIGTLRNQVVADPSNTGRTLRRITE